MAAMATQACLDLTRHTRLDLLYTPTVPFCSAYANRPGCHPHTSCRDKSRKPPEHAVACRSPSSPANPRSRRHSPFRHGFS